MEVKRSEDGADEGYKGGELVYSLTAWRTP